MLANLYRSATEWGAPFISLYLRRRLHNGREDSARFGERQGHASQQRPTGKLVWCHAASVGEAMSALSLLHSLRIRHPDYSILLTTGTVTSAQLLATRLPAGIIHQYVPVDRVPYVRNFLQHWRPDLALWVESELWPNMLAEIKMREIPALLINGRMSAKSFRNWKLAPEWARELLSTFQLCLTQTEAEQQRFRTLGAPQVDYVGNLKYAADPLPCEDIKLKQMIDQIAGRPTWLMASTHEGEEAIAIATHLFLAKKIPNLLTIIVPRHAVRGDKVAHMLTQGRIAFARRSLPQQISRDTAIYLADTMGELGLFYRLATVTCIGGSFVWGGHNPIEAAQLNRAIVFGPRMTNFAEIAKSLVEVNGAIQIHHPEELPETIGRLLSSSETTMSMAINAGNFTLRQKQVLGKVLDAISPWFDKLRKEAA